jgi:hypothetical protein
MQPQLPPLPLPRGSQWGLFYLSRGDITFHSLRNESGKIPKNNAHYVPQNRGNKKQWFITSTELRTLPSTELRTLRGARVIKNSGSLPVHRAEITLRGPRSRNIKKRLYRRVEMSDKGKVKKIRRLGNTVTFLISNKLPNKLPPST